LKPDAIGGDAGFFKLYLDKVETPDKYTVVITFKAPLWEAPTHFAQQIGYANVISKKQVETLGEEKAAEMPAGTGPYRLVERKQGSFYRFEAVPNHWRVTPGFKELVIRRMNDPAAAVAALRAGEIDVLPVNGDYLTQAEKAGFRLIDSPNAIE